MTEPSQKGRIKRLKQGWQRLSQEAEGAVKRLREGRMGSPYHTAYQVLGRATPLEIRRYRSSAPNAHKATTPKLVLLPPWPLTPELFDIAPELSAIGWLTRAGVDVWTISKPAKGQGDKTKDDAEDEGQILTWLAQSLSDIHKEAQGPLHLAGYSHSGQWIYHLAASAPPGVLASLIAFGVPAAAPVSRPFQRTRSIADRLLTQVWRGLRSTGQEPEQLPEAMGAYGVTIHEDHPREEAHHLFRLLGLVPKGVPALPPESNPDQEMRGLWGKIGSWLAIGARGDDAGPQSEEEADTPASLAALTLPLLSVVGQHDAVVPGAQIRHIKTMAPHAIYHEVSVDTGHFGLVVGPRAMSEVWPLLPSWMAWTDTQEGPPPFYEAEDNTTDATGNKGDTGPHQTHQVGDPGRQQYPVQRLYDLATDLVDGLWNKLEEVTFDVGTMVEAIRWQLPRLARLVSLTPDARVSLSLALAEQARALPHERFFSWDGQDWTYQQVDHFVEGMAQHLWTQGIRPKARIALACGNHPGLLLHLIALNRVGAIVAVLPAHATSAELSKWQEAIGFQAMFVDAMWPLEDVGDTKECLPDDVRLWHIPYPHNAHPTWEQLPKRPAPAASWAEDGHTWPGGQADASAMHVWTAGSSGPPKVVTITNRHWGLAALGAAAAAGLTSQDIVASCVPLHSSQGLLVAAGSAMLGGARLTLLDDAPTTLQQELVGLEATVLFGGERSLARLASFPLNSEANTKQVRAIIGSGVQPGLVCDLALRYPSASMLSSYSCSETNFALAHLREEKPGALGRPLLGQAALALVACDLATKEIRRGPNQQPLRCAPQEPGLLLSRTPTERPFPFFDGYVIPPDDAHNPHQIENLFAPNDRWFVSDDLLRQDEEGDYWFVDRLSEAFRHPTIAEDIFPYATSQALQKLPEVTMASAFRDDTMPGDETLVAVIELAPGQILSERSAYSSLAQALPGSHLPWRIVLCRALPTTSTGSVNLPQLRAWLQENPTGIYAWQRNDGTRRYQQIVRS